MFDRLAGPGKQSQSKPNSLDSCFHRNDSVERCFWSKCTRLPRPFGPPKKVDGSYGVRVEIAAVAALLRNDMSGVLLLHTS